MLILGHFATGISGKCGLKSGLKTVGWFIWLDGVKYVLKYVNFVEDFFCVIFNLFAFTDFNYIHCDVLSTL